MRVVLILVTLAAAFFVFDRLMLAAERRGWIYWRKTKPSSGSRSAAAGMFGEMNALASPAYRHVIEEQHRQEVTPAESARGEEDPIR